MTQSWLLFYFLTCHLYPTPLSNYMLEEEVKESRAEKASPDWSWVAWCKLSLDLEMAQS